MRFAAPTLAVLCALVLFTALDRPGYLDDHEARDAQVARDCLRHREVLTPQSGADPVFEKPMLAYAPEMLARSLSRSAASRNAPLRSRQFRALAALALVLLTGSIAHHRFGARAGWCAAISLVTMLGVPLAARTDGTQVFAALLGWCAAGVLWGAALGEQDMPDTSLALAYGALAGAMLVGGPLCALWPNGGIALYAGLARSRSAWSRTRPLAGLAIVAGLTLPWYGAEVYLHGARWLPHAFWFPYALDAHGAWYSGPLLALSVFVISCFPWSVLMPEATRHAAAEPDARSAHALIAILACALIPIAVHPGVPLSAALPALPAAAMLCGRFMDHVLEDPRTLQGFVSRAAQTLALLGSGAALLLALAATRLPEAAGDIRLLAAVTFVTSWLPLLTVWRGGHRIAIALIALPIGIGAPLTSLFVLPGLENYLNARAVAETMNERSPATAPLAVFAAPTPSLTFYTRRNIVNVTPDRAALAALRADDGLAYAAFPPSTEADLTRHLGIPLEVLKRTPEAVLVRVKPDAAFDSTAAASGRPAPREAPPATAR
jgi:4-amino-4-deoxy-L-arabinose transferase-like glycosyltransferase